MAQFSVFTCALSFIETKTGQIREEVNLQFEKYVVKRGLHSLCYTASKVPMLPLR